MLKISKENESENECTNWITFNPQTQPNFAFLAHTNSSNPETDPDDPSPTFYDGFFGVIFFSLPDISYTLKN